MNVNHAKGDPAGPRDYQDRIGQLRERPLWRRRLRLFAWRWAVFRRLGRGRGDSRGFRRGLAIRGFPVREWG